MPNTRRVARIDQIGFERLVHAAAVEGFTQPLSLVVRWPLSSTRTEPLQEGVQVDRLSPMASGSLESCSVSKLLILNDKTARHLRF